MKEIKLTKGKIAIVDDEDFDRLAIYSWHATSHGYAATRLRDGAETHAYMHRMVVGVLKGVQVDHINGNRLDNRRANLRPCTTVQNSRNSKARGSKFSRYKGVSFDKTRDKWIAQIHSGATKVQKRFDTEEAAARFYDDHARRLFGEFAQLNFPTESEAT